MILNRIRIFWPEHSLQAEGRRFETCTAHQHLTYISGTSKHRWQSDVMVVAGIGFGLGFLWEVMGMRALVAAMKQAQKKSKETPPNEAD
jgi:uncharacterized protein (DUF2252 family)